jgi:hypothetical protein
MVASGSSGQAVGAGLIGGAAGAIVGSATSNRLLPDGELGGQIRYLCAAAARWLLTPISSP